MNPRIVISANATLDEVYAASELRAAFADYQGAEVDIVYDDVTASNEDIYVGNTVYSKKVPVGNAYSVTTAGTCVYISAGSTYGFEAAVAAVCGELQTNGCLKSGLELFGNGDALQTCGQKQEGQIRFLTLNVYGWANTSHNTTVALRQPYQVSLLKSYDADILAFQEFSNSTEKGTVRYRSESFLADLAELGYSEVGDGTLLNTDGANFTPLFYKKDTLTVVDCGYLLYSGINDVNSKSVTWAVFSDQNGDRFIAMSTHFMWNDTTGSLVTRTEDMTDEQYSDLVDEAADVLRQQNAKELLALLSEIREEYGDLGVVIGGDMNTGFARTRHAPLSELEGGGLLWAQGTADDAGCAVNSVNGHGAYATWDSEKELFTSYYSHIDRDATYSIDHVWYEGISIELFATVADRYACFSSDHNPKIVDFSLQ
ncbi:MAG: hypothetical protein IJW55_09980 [Clostridia bacterium]|nr:hypothetical protein [Clostridia bacterium]MBQ7348275.1 hypothetical protein [Clostridia bacterium]